MSEEKFNEAKSGLAFSQSLLDSLRSQNMAQESQIMGAPMEQEIPTEGPTEEVSEPEEQPKSSIGEQIKEFMTPYMDKIMDLFKKDEPQEVEIKIDGEMTPKEDEK